MTDSSPVNYKPDDQVPTRANKLTSMTTAIPYSFYNLPFCKPSRLLHYPENLGEALNGDDYQSSIYEVGVSLLSMCYKCFLFVVSSVCVVESVSLFARCTLYLFVGVLVLH
jgi:hypothetical protein